MSKCIYIRIRTGFKQKAVYLTPRAPIQGPVNIYRGMGPVQTVLRGTKKFLSHALVCEKKFLSHAR